jgi:hypothetical protein
MDGALGWLFRKVEQMLKVVPTGCMGVYRCGRYLIRHADRAGGKAGRGADVYHSAGDSVSGVRVPLEDVGTSGEGIADSELDRVRVGKRLERRRK